MSSFHASAFQLLQVTPSLSRIAQVEVEQTERRLGIRLPASVREWYQYEDVGTEMKQILI